METLRVAWLGVSITAILALMYAKAAAIVGVRRVRRWTIRAIRADTRHRERSQSRRMGGVGPGRAG